jgi:hypothetical protein
MDDVFSRYVLKTALILLGSLIVGLCVPLLSLADETDDQSTTKVAPQQTPVAGQQGKPEQKDIKTKSEQQGAKTELEQKGTKTKLEPRDLLPSLLTPKPGTGSAATEQTLLSRDKGQLRRLERGNARINQQMRQLNYSIQKMRSDVNRSLRIRRQRY